MDRLIDAARLAQILDVPVSTIWTAAREGHLPCFKLGNKYRFDEEAVLKHLSFSKEDPFTAETRVA